MRARTTSAFAAVASLATVLGIASAPIATGSGESETVVVDAANPAGAKTANSLTAGVTYTVTAAGTFTWGLAGGTADAECSSLTPDPAWQPNRFAALYAPDDDLDLYVNGGPVDWQPASGSAADGPCDTATHTYRLAFTPKATGAATFAVVDKMNSNRSGKLTVTVTAPDRAAAAPAPAPAPPVTPAAKVRAPRATRVLSAAADRPATALPAPAPSSGRIRPFVPPNLPPTPGRTYGAAIKPPVLPKQPFHITTLGWLTLVVGIVAALGTSTFVLATRASAVDSSLRVVLASVLRTALGRSGAGPERVDPAA